MKLKTITKAALALALLSATSAFAADGSSGCGPGWYIFKENSMVSSALRATTNGWSSPVVTIGMTFGTSNCAQHKLVMNDKRGLHFVTHNTNNLLAVDLSGGWLCDAEDSVKVCLHRVIEASLGLPAATHR